MQSQLTTRCFVAAAALTIVSGTTALASNTSALQRLQLERGEPYSNARTNLRRLDWAPLESKGEERTEGDAGQMLRAGWSEVSDCSGTGRNFCGFIWKRRSQCALITTAGEYFPKYRSPTVWAAEIDSCEKILDRR